MPDSSFWWISSTPSTVILGSALSVSFGSQQKARQRFRVGERVGAIVQASDGENGVGDVRSGRRVELQLSLRETIGAVRCVVAAPAVLPGQPAGEGRFPPKVDEPGHMIKLVVQA